MYIQSFSGHHSSERCQLQHQVLQGGSDIYDHLHQALLDTGESLCYSKEKVLHPLDFYTGNYIYMDNGTFSSSLFEDSREFKVEDLAELLEEIGCH